jgi:hypothetical protein
MGAAGSAKGYLPAMPGKPGEFFAGFPDWSNAGNLAEAADNEGQTGRIEKSVLVAVVDLDRLVAVGDCRAADAAENGVLLFRRQGGPGLRRPPVCRARTL